MINTKFYYINLGWATKYFWFDIIEKINPSAPPKETFEELITKNRFTFTKQSGPTQHPGTHFQGGETYVKYGPPSKYKQAPKPAPPPPKPKLKPKPKWWQFWKK